MVGGMLGEGGHVWQGGMHGKGGVHGRGGGGSYVAGEMATNVGSTHPTGMHSCLFNKNYGIWIHYTRNVILN